MSNSKFTNVALAVCGLAVLAATPARADLLDDVMQAKKIRISTDLAIPPSGIMDSSMKPTGSDVEVAQLLAGIGGSNSNSSRPPAPRAFPTC